MANACFRCKSPIDAGETFCRGCRGQVSLDFAYTRESRLWLVVAVAPVLALLVVGGTVVRAALQGPVDASIAVTLILAFPFAIAFAYALYRDCQHLQRRDDAGWAPSKWNYAVLAFASIALIVPMFLIAPYHLYRRKRSVGLALRRT